MVGIIDKMKNLFGYHHQVSKIINGMENARKKDDARIKELEKATIDGDEDWFLQMAKKDPSCALRVIEECNTHAKSR